MLDSNIAGPFDYVQIDQFLWELSNLLLKFQLLMINRFGQNLFGMWMNLASIWDYQAWSFMVVLFDSTTAWFLLILDLFKNSLMTLIVQYDSLSKIV